jgi:hypothetical protein
MPVSTFQCLPALYAMLLLPNVAVCIDAPISTEPSVRKVSTERVGLVGTIWSPSWDSACPDSGSSCVPLVSSSYSHDSVSI